VLDYDVEADGIVSGIFFSSGDEAWLLVIVAIVAATVDVDNYG
jgi:hypothetical protein